MRGLIGLSMNKPDHEKRFNSMEMILCCVSKCDVRQVRREYCDDEGTKVTPGHNGIQRRKMSRVW